MRTTETPVTPLRLHLGCGTRYLEGYYHVDIYGGPHIDRVANVDTLDFIASQSVDEIYASHVLEHFGRHEYHSVLEEWYRVLRPDGTLMLAVPDFRAIAEFYLSDGRCQGISDVLGLCVGGQRDKWDVHRMVFDEQLLTNALLCAGFRRVEKWSWTETSHANIDDYSQAYLPHMDKVSGRHMSLNLQALR